MKSLDLMLLYYDKPGILKNWLYRLAFKSDFLKFSNRIRIIVTDTGTPWDKISESLKLIQYLPDAVRKRVTYIRCETEEIRKRVPPEIDARPMCHAKNVIALDYSEADVILTSMLGNVFSPDYFGGHIAKHLIDPKAVVLPKRFDLFSNSYHTEGYKAEWEEVLKGDIRPSGGWPDVSVRRHWLKEIGGWDESYIAISPDDMDMGSRLTGKLDNEAPSEALFTLKGHFNNLGLTLYQPYYPTFYSLTCNTYPGHVAKEDPRRQRGYEIGIQHYLANWGVVKRNENRVPIKYDILDFERPEKYE